MNNMLEEQAIFLSMLMGKKELVFKLLRMANDTSLAEENAADNAERYISLVETREEVINEIEKLNGELAKLTEPPGVSWETGLLKREIAEMTEQIVRVETEIRKKASNIMTNLQQEIANMNKRKKVSDAYDSAGFYGER